jgi:hypothetical protein
MFEIVIDQKQETGDCVCVTGNCSFHEEAISHAEICTIQWHAAQHVATTGHLVEEHYGGMKIVKALNPAEF